MPPAASHCLACRTVFPSAAIRCRLDGETTPQCPRCGMDAVFDGAPDEIELEHGHVVLFGAWGLIADALAKHGVPRSAVIPGYLIDGPSDGPQPSAVYVEGTKAHLRITPPVRCGDRWEVRLLDGAPSDPPWDAVSSDDVARGIAARWRHPGPDHR